MLSALSALEDGIMDVMGEDDGFELDDFYMIDDFTLSDVFTTDLPPIQDTPQATAAFSTFVNELEALTTPPPIPTFLPPNLPDSQSPHVGAQVQGSDDLLGPAAQLLAAHAGRDADYPDLLDSRALLTHALPLNIAADARGAAGSAHAVAARIPARALTALPVRRLAQPTRTWGANGGPSPTAAARGRPRVREMRHPGGTPGAGAKLRYSKGAAPSKYCHVCGRSAKTVSVALCGNNRLGLCRKVVCDKCLLMHQRDSWDVAKTPGSDWICMHCRARCPERARCHQYQRNNLKRRMRGNTSPPLASLSGRAGASPSSSLSSRVVKPARNRRVARVAKAIVPTVEGEVATVPVAESGCEDGIADKMMEEGDAQKVGEIVKDGFEQREIACVLGEENGEESQTAISAASEMKSGKESQSSNSGKFEDVSPEEEVNAGSGELIKESNEKMDKVEECVAAV